MLHCNIFNCLAVTRATLLAALCPCCLPVDQQSGEASAGRRWAAVHQRRHPHRRAEIRYRRETASQYANDRLASVASDRTVRLHVAVTGDNISRLFTRTWLRYVRVFAIANPSVVCNVLAPYLRGWNFRQYFFAILHLSYPLTTVQNFTEIVSGNPSVEALNEVVAK